MIHIEPKFELSLLDETPARQIAYFQGKVFQHRHLNQAHALAMDRPGR